MSSGRGGPRVVVALDFADAVAATAMASRLDPALCRVKVGKELFTRAGPEVVHDLVGRGFGVFLDLKFHDIPNTVAGACRAAADLGVWMLNVHASGGPAMLAAARAAIEGDGAPLLTAVTVLTSLAAADLDAIGMQGGPEACVARLARLAAAADLDGVVCSPREIATVRAATPPGFLAVTPGIRPAGAAHGDQKRVTTPGEAVRAGADFLVIGRPVTAAADPMAALAAIDAEVRVGDPDAGGRGART